MTIAEAIREIVKSSLPLVCDFGTVTSVDEETFLCDIDIEGKSPVGDVRLFCGDYETDAKGGGIVVIPEVGAQVLVIFFSKTVAFMLQCSKAKKIVFNGGELGGLVLLNELKSNLEKLTKRVDGIIDAINNAVPSTGAPDSGLALQTTMKTKLATLTDKEDFSKIENKKILQ